MLLFFRTVGIQWIYLYLCHLINSLRYNSWLTPCCRNNLLWSLKSCLFWASSVFVPMDIHNMVQCVVLIRVACWMFVILWLTYSILYNFSFQHNINFRDCLSCNRVQFSCDFVFLMWSSLQILQPIIRPISFRIQGYLYPLVGPGHILGIWLILPYRSFRQLCKCIGKWFSFIW